MSSPQRGVQNATVSVTVDLTNYPASDPTITCSPNTAQMSRGQDNITWNLSATNAGQYTVKFAATDGIVFKSTNPNTFPGTLTRSSDIQYTATDNNAAGADYPYTVNIVVYNQGGVGRSFAKDPDVENET